MPTMDTKQGLDVYENEIAHALTLFGLNGIHALREHQASTIAHDLHRRHLFLVLATGAGKSLCFQVSAVIQATYQSKVPVVFQPTPEIISSQVRAPSAYCIDVEIISSLTSSAAKDELAERLNGGYRPALICTTVQLQRVSWSTTLSLPHFIQGKLWPALCLRKGTPYLIGQTSDELWLNLPTFRSSIPKCRANRYCHSQPHT